MQYMIERFVWGFVSPAEVQRVAAYMKQDIETAVAHASEGHTVVFPQVNNMEQIGNHGQNSQNMHRGLVNNLYDICISRCKLVELQMKNFGGVGLRTIHQAFLFPHELFHTMYTYYREAFNERILVSSSRLSSFWDSVAHTHTAVFEPPSPHQPQS